MQYAGLNYFIRRSVCIGRKLAYMELSIVFPTFVFGFERELAVPGSDVEVIERLESNPNNLFVKAKAREGVSFSI